MKLAYTHMEQVLQFGDGYARELVIENKDLFCSLLHDIAMQMEGLHGSAVLSIDEKPVEMSRHAELIDRFIPFDINQKSLLSKLCQSIEKEAIKPENFLPTNDFLKQTELFMDSLCFDFPCKITFGKLTIGSMIRAIAPEFEDTDKSPLEKLYDYMSLVREFDRDRLFILVNCRCFFSDPDVEQFIHTAVMHDFKLLFLESTARPILKHTKRITIDNDLCEF